MFPTLARSWILRILLLLGPAVSSPAAHPAPSDLPGPVSMTTWRGYTQLEFPVAGRPCRLVLPEQAAPGRPWIWRAEFFGHAPQVDLALLARGWHVAYIQASDLYGAPPAMALFDAFYQHLISTHRLARRTVLEGLSRGGLYAFNFAATYPDRVAALYLDAPVLNLQSWPGRSRETPEGAKLWRECREAYGLDDAGMLAFKGSPIDRVEPVARAGIPILSVCGDADINVPLPENTAILAERYRARRIDRDHHQTRRQTPPSQPRKSRPHRRLPAAPRQILTRAREQPVGLGWSWKRAVARPQLNGRLSGPLRSRTSP